MTDYEQFLEENGLTEADCQREKATARFLPRTELENRNLRVAPSEIEGLGLFSVKGLPSHVAWPEAMVDGQWTFAGRYMNHSPSPNCDFSRGPDGYVFWTKKEIRPGEELTVNYRDVKRAMSETNNRRGCVSSAV